MNDGSGTAQLLSQDIEGGPDALDFNIERDRRLVHLAEWMRRSGRFDEAMTYADQAATHFAAMYPAEHARHGAVACMRALILRDQGHLKEAEPEMRRAVGILDAGIGKTANATIEAEFQLAQLLAALGQEAEARTVIVRIVPLLETRFVETALLRAQVAELQQTLGAG